MGIKAGRSGSGVRRKVGGKRGSLAQSFGSTHDSALVSVFWRGKGWLSVSGGLICRARVTDFAASIAAHSYVGLLRVGQEAFQHAQT